MKESIRLSWACLVVLAISAGLRGDEPKSPTPDDLSGWWADLEKPDPEASTALLHLADYPRITVAFLKDKLAPVSLTRDELEPLLDKLGSDDEGEWKPAFEKLDYLDPRLAVELESLMAKVTESPTRQRIVELMSGRPADSLAGQAIVLRKVGDDGYNFSSRGSWWAEHKIERLNVGYGNRKRKWTRAVRALVLLKHIGTPDAVAILKRMAVQGHPEAQPTRVARKLALKLAKP